MLITLTKAMLSTSIQQTDMAKKAKMRSKQTVRDKIAKLKEQKAQYMKSYNMKIEQLSKQMERMK